MPIRINLLAEQQAAEEARRKDPIKRAIMAGSVAVVLMLVWVLVLHMQLKGKRLELGNIDADFRKVDEKAKTVKNIQAQAGDIERRIVSLERYSTNRVLWANMLDALQKVRIEEIRYKSISSNQRYPTNAPTTFFTTNLLVPFTPSPPAWKFWASQPPPVQVFPLASNMFKAFTNNPPFSTNKVPYTVKMAITRTNDISHELLVKCDFNIPAVTTEDIDVQISGGDYGNPPGGTLDAFAKKLSDSEYFTNRLTKGPERAKFIELAPRPEPDLTLPNSPMHTRFTLRMKYEDRLLTNE